MLKIGEALALAKGRIDNSDARILLREASGFEAATLIAHPERVLSPDAQTRFKDYVARRENGEPIAYILGWREFYGHRFAVTPATLIPRPDTELLVERALLVLNNKAGARALDLGTGTGAIAITLALECTTAAVTAVDFSAEALAVAQQNANNLKAQVRFMHGSWFAPLGDERFDCIVSNPPYVAVGDAHLAQGDVRFEPPSALVSGNDGLDDIRQIVAHAPKHLLAGGWLLLEHGYDQAQRCRDLLRRAGFARVESWRDLAGIERVSGGCV